MKDPIPKPPIIMPEINPSRPGKYYQAIDTPVMYVAPLVKPKVIEKTYLND